MKKLSQKEIIRRHLQRRPEQWFVTHDLTQKNLDDGWVGTAGMRRADELWREGWLHKEDVPGGNEVMYKYKTKWVEKEVPVIVERDGVRMAIMQKQLFEVK